MSEQILTLLKLCLLAMLYLFFFRVLRAVWAEVRAPAAARLAAPAPAPAAGVAPAGAPAPKARRGRSGRPTQLAVVEPAERRGTTFGVGPELTIGRGGGCAIALPDDTFVSTLHARVFTNADGTVMVEDLGSTNGTFLNRAKVTSPAAVGVGDRIQVGNTILEAKP